jgi:delta 1-pyrroline-5-carboxylate dehydrogenase
VQVKRSPGSLSDAAFFTSYLEQEDTCLRLNSLSTLSVVSAINPGLTPQFMKLVKERQKADALAAKRQKELAALTAKQTKATKEQTALAKAKAVLDKANAVFNLDLIQNTAALQGKLTDDETLRLKLQREILLGNSDAAAKLSQELLSVQLAAVMAATVDPFGEWSKSAMAAMKALKELRNDLATLGTPSVVSPEQLLAQDYAAALADAVNPEFAMLDGLAGYRDAFSRGPGTANSYQNITISIDPTAAQYGIGVASVNNSANGNSNNYSTIQSFAGGM